MKRLERYKGSVLATRPVMGNVTAAAAAAAAAAAGAATAGAAALAHRGHPWPVAPLLLRSVITKLF
jgi:hypothetical protein